MKKVPRWLQPILWSIRVSHLDIEKDKVYIINQILGFGGMRALKWLFKTYSKRTIKEAFIKKPLKVYTPASFNFTKDILLKIKNKKLDPYKYDITLPRRIKP